MPGRAWRGRPVTATLDQVYALLVTANRKLDTLVQEAGIIMSQADDLSAELAADTQAVQGAVDALNGNYDRLNALVAQLEAGQGQPVDPAVVASFRATLAELKPAVDKITTVGAAPAPGPSPSPTPPPGP